MDNSNSVVVTKNFIWRFAERSGAQMVSLVVSIVLARLLAPEDYGLISLVTVFIAIMQTFVDCGLGTALIQKKDADELDFSSVFYFNFCMCLAVYLLMFIAAPYIARFYNNTDLVPLVRVISLTIVVSGVKGIQQAYVSRHMLFRRFFYATLGGTLFSALLGIGIALAGGGVWALVAQQLSNTVIDTLILWLTVKWRPKWMFSWTRLVALLSFGWKMLAAALLDTVYNNLRSLIIGKVYSSADLAYYNKGNNFPNMIITNINASIDSVLLPAMANAQDERARIKSMTQRSIKVSVYVIAPMMMGLAFCAEPLIRVLLTEKWMQCVPYMRIFCITYMFYPIHTANLNAIKAMGRSDYFLKLEIIKKITGVTILLLTMWHGVMIMAYSLLLSTAISMIINSYPNRELLHYGYWEQMKDIMPGVLLAVVMGLCIYPISWLPIPDIAVLVLQIPAGAAIYILLSKALHIETFDYLWTFVEERLRSTGHLVDK